MIHYVEVWKISKDSKIPYTDQLVGNIRWSIFTREAWWTEKLPPIRILADELRISVNTVRNTYKWLERQELVVTRSHIETVVQTESTDKKKLEEELVTSIKNAICYQLSVDEIRGIVDKVLREAEESKKKSVIFVYEERNIGHRFAMQIAREAGVQAEEVRLDQLRNYLGEHRDQIGHLDAIITAYFQYAQVRSIARSYQPIIYGMTVEVAPDVMGALQSLKSDSVATVIYEKEESVNDFVNLIHRMCPELDVEVYYEGKRSGWKRIAQKASIICVSPQLAEEVRQCDWKIPVYEMWDRINEQSVDMLKDYLHQIISGMQIITEMKVITGMEALRR